MNQEEPSYFLLTGADQHRSLIGFPSAYQTCRNRLERGVWSLRASTPYRSEMKTGDHVVIYASGKREFGQHFVGTAQIADEPQPRRALSTALPQLVAISSDMSIVDYLLPLNRINVFSHPKSIIELKNKLSFIKNPSSPKWGCYLQVGSRRITKRDFLLIQNKV